MAERPARTPHSVGGVLPSPAIEALIGRRGVTAARPIAPDQIQPASLDLRLGSRAYRVRASFLPGAYPVDDRLGGDLVTRFNMYEIDLSKGAVLERGCVYVVPLMEGLALDEDISAYANPKSSTGRLDVFTRLIIDRARKFDRVPRGYRGPLYAEVSPRTFSIMVRSGSRLNQLRFKRGAARSNVRRVYGEHRPVDGPLGWEDLVGGLPVAVDLKGDGGPVGWKARPHASLIDIDAVDYYDPAAFWEPVEKPRSGGVILNPGDFHILASRKPVRIPPDHAAEMVAYDTLAGEFRAHYAGFFDPGFGHDDAGGEGTRAVFEVRSHDVPFVIEDGQIMGRLLFERLTGRPPRLYGRESGSSYQRQGLALAKQFVRQA